MTKYVFWLGVFVFLPSMSQAVTWCGIANYGGVVGSVDARYPPASTQWHATFYGINTQSTSAEREAAFTRAIQIYKGIHGLGSLPNGNALKLVYTDGSMECALVTSQSDTLQGEPIDGTQEAAGGGAGGGGEPLSYYFYTPAWEHICDYQYSDGELVGYVCYYEQA